MQLQWWTPVGMADADPIFTSGGPHSSAYPRNIHDVFCRILWRHQSHHNNSEKSRPGPQEHLYVRHPRAHNPAILPAVADERICQNAPTLDASHCMQAAGSAANVRVCNKGPCLIVKKLALDETKHQRRLSSPHVPQQDQFRLLDRPRVTHLCFRPQTTGLNSVTALQGSLGP